MAFFFYGMAILALVGAGLIVRWARRSSEGVTIGVVIMAGALFVAGAAMILTGLVWR